MSNENGPVIVTHRSLSEAIGKAYAQTPDALAEAVKAPDPEGFESDEPPATEEEARQFEAELERALKVLADEEKAPGVLAAPDDQFTSLLQSLVAERAAEESKVKPAEDGSGGLEAQFDNHDLLGWAKSLFTWVKKLKPHRFLPPPAAPESLPGTFRTAILGDWGTGLYGAPVCAASIQQDPRDYQLLLHLGDVYYSGTDKEITDRFLNLWPKKPGAVSRACNSNHEMYTGGRAYFRQTLAQFGQASSCFAMQNDHWLLVGLDSAYTEGSLAAGGAFDQVGWLRGLIGQAGDRRVLLFSHHQLYSWAEGPKPVIQGQLAELLTDKKIFGWYWGHEHRCMLFDRHPQWGIYGRCVGHSGFPYWRDNFQGQAGPVGPQDTFWLTVTEQKGVPGGLLLEGPNVYVPGHTDKYGPQGYMTLEFDGAHLNEIVHAPDGSEQFNRQLV